MCSAVETCNAVRCRSVQRGAVTVLYGTFQLNTGQCSVVQSGEVKLRLRQSSPAKCSAVQFSLLNCCPAQSSPVQSTPLTYGPVHLEESVPVQSSPVQSSSNSFPSSKVNFNPAQPRCIQVNSSRVLSSQVQCRAVQCVTAQPSPVPFRPVQNN